MKKKISGATQLVLPWSEFPPYFKKRCERALAEQKFKKGALGETVTIILSHDYQVCLSNQNSFLFFKIIIYFFFF